MATMQDQGERMTKEIALTQGKYAVIDDEDFDMVSKHKWYYYRYALAEIEKDHLVSLGRFVLANGAVKQNRLGEKDNIITCHINGDRLDCRRCNLINIKKGTNLTAKDRELLDIMLGDVDITKTELAKKLNITYQAIQSRYKLLVRKLKINDYNIDGIDCRRLIKRVEKDSSNTLRKRIQDWGNDDL